MTMASETVDGEEQRWIETLRQNDLELHVLDWKDVDDVNGVCQLLNVSTKNLKERNRVKAFLHRLSISKKAESSKAGTTDLEDQSGSFNRDAEKLLERLIIKHRLIDTKGRPKRTLSYVSKSHAFSSLVVQGRLSFGNDFFFDLVNPVSTEAFQSPGPDPSEDENNVHHRYFLAEMKTLLDSAVAAGHSIQQQLLWTKAGHWLKLDDGISAGVEPDFCSIDCFPKSVLVASPNDICVLPSKYNVTMCFEQKKRFHETDQMEIIDYGERILSIQRGRLRVYTALFNCTSHEKVIRWAETREVNGEFFSTVTKPASLLPGEEGQRQLITMLSKSSSDLGRDFPKFEQLFNGQRLNILSLVGEGATSHVYQAQLGGVDGAVKVTKCGLQRVALQEKRILDHLKSYGVAAGLLGSTQVAEHVLFFDKLLQPFTGTFSFEQVTNLLNFLECVHSAGVVHRDIRPENIMEDSLGSLYLIDWGFALLYHDVGDVDPQFEGTFRFGSEAVVKDAKDSIAHHYLPKDDLEALVKTVLAVNSGGQRLLKKALEILPGDFAAALNLWTEEQQARGDSFRLLFEAARSTDYDYLKMSLVY